MDISTINPRRTGRETIEAAEHDLPAGARARFAELRQRAIESEESAEMKHRLGERMIDLTEEYFPRGSHRPAPPHRCRGVRCRPRHRRRWRRLPLRPLTAVA